MTLAPKTFELELADGVALITLNRPERLNALTFDVYGELKETFRSLGADTPAANAARAVVITGKGRLGTGVLRSRLFDWIADPDLRPFIAGYASAHPKHGGSGAVYLFLRSKR